MEVGVGLFVALGFVALLILAMRVSNLAELTGGSGYDITVNFDNIGGLKARSSVTMAGVRIGRVASIEFDSEQYVAVVVLNIEEQYDRIPIDTSASIFTAGLLGEQYIGLEPGAEEEYVTAGGELTLTQSAIVLEQIIGQFLYSQADGGSQ